MIQSTEAGSALPSFVPKVLPASDHGELPPGFAPLRLTIDDTNYVLELTRPEMVAGRHSKCDVHLAHPEVSRRHCRFVFQDGAWFVEDRISLNGIYVNDEKVVRRQLYPEDRIRVGVFTLIVQPPADGGAVIRSIADALPERRMAS